ncbi:hypothetical protein F5Y02DRAFT_426281 [Annulohypoxylon stygium]|nr:hypothetical protein F5Y02DRAFT_426281 [Annulohypoxylon stygium]
MTVALSLKVQHIWIDSLCIIQDDNDDWKSQSSSMGLIYQNACCNIAATWGVDGTAGCFSERDGSSKSIKVIVNGDSGLKEHVVYDKFAYKSEITDASLNKRGWVTQERNLARKQLSFAKSQVYWECSELSASEDFPEGIPRGMEDLRQKKLMSTRWIGLDHIEEYKFRHTWIHLVESYSECKLKKLSDESAALAGVAGYMKTATNNTYLAGLWKKDLEQQLLWRRKSSQSCPSESPSYIAPTWSWMCLDAPVQYDRGYTLKNTTYESRYKPIPYSAEILEVSVEPFDAMHSFRSAEVKLRGIAIRAAVISTEPSEESGSCVTWRTLQLADEIGITQGIHIGVGISWDRSAVSEQNLLFMFVSTGQIKCYAGDMNGLVLKGSNENELVYHRLGVFSTAVPYIYLKGREIDLSHIIRERLAVKNSRANDNGSTSVAQEYLNLDDERLKGLVHTVTII